MPSGEYYRQGLKNVFDGDDGANSVESFNKLMNARQ